MLPGSLRSARGKRRSPRVDKIEPQALAKRRRGFLERAQGDRVALRIEHAIDFRSRRAEPSPRLKSTIKAKSAFGASGGREERTTSADMAPCYAKSNRP
jgi:hypothetical protein